MSSVVLLYYLDADSMTLASSSVSFRIISFRFISIAVMLKVSIPASGFGGLISVIFFFEAPRICNNVGILGSLISFVTVTKAGSSALVSSYLFSRPLSTTISPSFNSIFLAYVNTGIPMACASLGPI